MPCNSENLLPPCDLCQEEQSTSEHSESSDGAKTKLCCVTRSGKSMSSSLIVVVCNIPWHLIAFVNRFPTGAVRLRNPHIELMDQDVLYHLALGSGSVMTLWSIDCWWRHLTCLCFLNFPGNDVNSMTFIKCLETSRCVLSRNTFWCGMCRDTVSFFHAVCLHGRNSETYGAVC